MLQQDQSVRWKVISSASARKLSLLLKMQLKTNETNRVVDRLGEAWDDAGCLWVLCDAIIVTLCAAVMEEMAVQGCKRTHKSFDLSKILQNLKNLDKEVFTLFNNINEIMLFCYLVYKYMFLMS